MNQISWNMSLVSAKRAYLLVLCYIWVILGDVRADYVISKQLFNNILLRSGYNRHIRPVLNVTDKINVRLGLSLLQIIDVDERNQYMTTNVWARMDWRDPFLTWDPDDYRGVTEIYVPQNSIWHPEIVLYNNADGKYELTTSETKAKLSWNGTVLWRPPGRMRSSCTMDVRFFPFDQQECAMQFGSWTYNLHEVEIEHYNSSRAEADGTVAIGMDLGDFYRSSEWDILTVPSLFSKINYAGDPQPFPMWTFQIRLRRKYRFYVVNLIIPLVAHSIMTILIFYLPSDSKEKISLSINILLSLTVFFLLLQEIMPNTSLVLPMLGEYLLFTLFLVTVSLFVTVITMNVHFRSSATHSMPTWVRKIFLYILPRVLRMKRPKVENSHDLELEHIRLDLCNCSCFSAAWKKLGRGSGKSNMYQFGSKRTKTQMELLDLSRELDAETDHQMGMSPEVSEAIQGAIFIAKHLKEEDEFNRTVEDWKYVALVIDRIFLLIYLATCAVGTVAVFCSSPILYDKEVPMVT